MIPRAVAVIVVSLLLVGACHDGHGEVGVAADEPATPLDRLYLSAYLDGAGPRPSSFDDFDFNSVAGVLGHVERVEALTDKECAQSEAVKFGEHGIEECIRRGATVVVAIDEVLRGEIPAGVTEFRTGFPGVRAVSLEEMERTFAAAGPALWLVSDPLGDGRLAQLGVLFQGEGEVLSPFPPRLTAIPRHYDVATIDALADVLRRAAA